LCRAAFYIGAAVSTAEMSGVLWVGHVAEIDVQVKFEMGTIMEYIIVLSEYLPGGGGEKNQKPK
jgi:hypothetical protein